jgi:hypothetical protein
MPSRRGTGVIAYALLALVLFALVGCGSSTGLPIRHWTLRAGGARRRVAFRIVRSYFRVGGESTAVSDRLAPHTSPPTSRYTWKPAA